MKLTCTAVADLPRNVAREIPIEDTRHPMSTSFLCAAYQGLGCFSTRNEIVVIAAAWYIRQLRLGLPIAGTKEPGVLNGLTWKELMAFCRGVVYVT